MYNLQDIFPDSLAGTGLVRKDGLIWRIGRVVENFTYKHADKIIVISEGFKRNIMAKGVPEEKIVVVYNWVDQNAVKNVARKDNKLFDKYHLDRNKFYITYSGNIGLTQNMDLLLDVARSLEDNEEIQFVLIGEGLIRSKSRKLLLVIISRMLLFYLFNHMKILAMCLALEMWVLLSLNRVWVKTQCQARLGA